jgi:uncharacterized membrane protein (DUF373 family)
MALRSWRIWQKFFDYELFERIALGSLMCLLGVIIVYVTVLVVVQIANDFMLGASFLDNAVLRDTFGSILTIVILLEFNHSIYIALKQKSGAIQIRVIIRITVLVIARKLMLQEVAATNFQTLLGFGGLLLALGALYWLISSADRRNPMRESPDDQSDGTASSSEEQFDVERPGLFGLRHDIRLPDKDAAV